MKRPDAFGFILLALAAFRVTRLVGWDDLTIGARRWVTGVGDDDHHKIARFVDEVRQEGGDPWDEQAVSGDALPVGPKRFYLGKMIRCPWCAGWWISLGVWADWLSWPRLTIWACVPFAISAIVGLVAKQWDA